MAENEVNPPKDTDPSPGQDLLPPRSGRFLFYGTLVELGLVPLAWLLGWLTGLWSWKELVDGCGQVPSLLSLALGVVATLPMLVMLVAVLQASSAAFVRLRLFLREGLLPYIRTSSLPALLCLSLAAGLGEEWLFRGMLQQGLLAWWDGVPAPVGILIVAVIFGACHWITHLYFLLATITGIYLGWLYWASGSLVQPVLAHALYDFIALVVITRWDIQPGSRSPSSEELENSATATSDATAQPE